jgi:Domain of unknown function (DUF4190)
MARSKKMAKTEVLDTSDAATPAAAPAATPAKYDFTKLNTLAVVSLATAISWVGAVAGVITGHIALAQIKRSGEKGRGLAITGLVLGYLYIAGSIFFGLLMLLFRLRGWIGADDMGGRQYGSYGTGMMTQWRN